MSGEYELSKNTLAIWGGEMGQDFWQRSTQVPVVHSVSFGDDQLDEWQALSVL